MSFSRMMEATDHVARLPDCPTASEGYGPAELKAVFDQGATQIKEFLNRVLLRELEANAAGASAAEHLGSAYVEGLTGNTVHEQIRSLKQLADRLEKQGEEAILGQIPDGSLTEEKLGEALLALLHQEQKRSLCHVGYTQSGTYRFEAPFTGRYRVRAVGAGGGGTLCCPQGAPAGSFDAVGGPAGAYAEVNVHMEQGASISISVGKGGVPAEYAVGQILTGMEYDGEYLSNGLYCTPGGDTELHWSNEKRLLVHGGGDSLGGSKVQCYGEWEYPAVTRRGLAYSAVECRQGADSFLGQGAGYGEAAGMGAGGAGGRLYWGEDGDRQVLELPSQGGDGAVLIDYIGGEA